MASNVEKIEVVDSHTGGEPTRVVISGFPSHPSTDPVVVRDFLRDQADHYRRATINEPRGSDILVGAVLLPSHSADEVAGVVFFNNVGYLGMCGHGTIGLVETLQWLDRILPGKHLIETPVGPVGVELHEDGDVSVRNVPAYRYRQAVTVHVEGHGPVVGDIAYGGNWFFLVQEHGQDLQISNSRELTDFCLRIRTALESNCITGENGALIDHIELFGPPQSPQADSRNFVLCPGGAYDRSPCGTGTSAKLACLYADGKLKPDQDWVQESITGSIFRGTIQEEGGNLIPTIRGRAHVNARATLIVDPNDPIAWGLD